MNRNGVKMISDSLKVYCKATEYNSCDLELECTQKLQPCTKHINTIYHKFRSYVRAKSISILSIDMLNKIAAIFTKLLLENEFLSH